MIHPYDLTFILWIKVLKSNEKPYPYILHFLVIGFYRTKYSIIFYKIKGYGHDIFKIIHVVIIN